MVGSNKVIMYGSFPKLLAPAFHMGMNNSEMLTLILFSINIKRWPNIKIYFHIASCRMQMRASFFRLQWDLVHKETFNIWKNDKQGIVSICYSLAAMEWREINRKVFFSLSMV